MKKVPECTSGHVHPVRINECMSDELRRKVIETVLPGREPVWGGNSRNALNHLLNEYTTAPSHKHTTRAPVEVQRKAALFLFEQHCPAVGHVLALWLQARKPLMTRVAAFLEHEGSKVANRADQAVRFAEETDSVEIERLVDRFREDGRLPDDVEEVALMLACLAARMPVRRKTPFEKEPEQVGPATMSPPSEPEQGGDTFSRADSPPTPDEEVAPVAPGGDSAAWADLLACAESHGPDSPLWDEVDRFVRILSELRDTRLQERNGHRRELAAAIERLAGDFADELEYMQFVDLGALDADCCPRDVASTALARCESLMKLLGEHATVRAQRASNRSQEERRYKQIDRLEREIASGVCWLRQVMPRPARAEDDGRPPERHPEADPQTRSETPPETQTDADPQTRSETPPETQTDADPQTQSETPPERHPEADPQTQSETPPETQTDADPQTQSETPPETHPDADPHTQPERHPEGTPSQEDDPTPPPTPERRITAGIREPVRSSVEVAQDIPEDENEAGQAAWATLLVSLLREDDLAGAYWIARHIETQGSKPPLPSPLLAAVAGARWFPTEPGGRGRAWAEAILRIAEEHVEPGGRQEDVLLAYAAAIRLALVAPNCGTGAWLTLGCSLRPVFELAQSVHELEKNGVVLQPGLLHGVVDATQCRAAVEQAGAAVADWLETVKRRRMKCNKATEVLKQLVGPQGVVGQALQPAAKNASDDAERVRRALKQWDTRESVLALIDRTDGPGKHPRSEKILGEAREQLMRELCEGIDLAVHWCDLLEQEKRLADKRDWVRDRLIRVHHQLASQFPGAEKSLRSQMRDGRSGVVSAAAGCLLRALEQLGNALQLGTQNEARKALDGFPPPSGGAGHDLVEAMERLAASADTLDDALRARLLWLPDLACDDSLQPLEESRLRLGALLRDQVARRHDLRHALRERIARKDFRFRSMVELGLGSHWSSESAHFREELEGCRSLLRERITKASTQIEQEVVDGVLGDERAEYSSRLEAIDIAQTLCFAPALAQVDRLVDDLKRAREARICHQRERMLELHRSWPGDEGLRRLLEEALERGDTRVVDEGLAELSAALEEGRTVTFPPPDKSRSRNLSPPFSQTLEALRETLGSPADLGLVNQGLEARSCVRGGLDFTGVPEDRALSAQRAIGAWKYLKARALKNYSLVKKLLEFLGFTLGSEEDLAPRKSASDWSHYQVPMSAAGLARPIPQFGSQSHDLYDVLCVWERPGADAVATSLREARLESTSAIVLYLGSLSPHQRRSLGRTSRDRHMALAVLDELLLVHLCAEKEVRLSAFLRYSLPYTLLNPYTPFQAGDVPPEMYFGRRDMARELVNPHGSCLVYGGRQLGKSALLRHVMRSFHRPDQGQHACYEDIKLVGDPNAEMGPESLWRLLRDALHRAGLGPATASEKPENVRAAIQKAFTDSSRRRMLAMFDEADNFLDADAREGFKVVTPLKNLMLDTQRRFKVVFAGLHNVQRFQNIPNQPLGHIGAPILVGPLEPRHAMDLIRVPFEVLGFDVSETTCLRILSFTNYHPGLIQLFCQRLLALLSRQVGSERLPYAVKQEDVEAVYRQAEVRDAIRDRFDWTLALDPRYQAIAWSMIQDQVTTRDSFSRPYDLPQLLDMALYWWSAGFEGVRADEMRGILNEMQGLGVLARTARGEYRLRSPNLVRLMGSEADISTRLLELGNRERPVAYDEDSNHVPHDMGRFFSPLTRAQERLLVPMGYGVSVVMASDALDFGRLEPMVERFVPGTQEESGRIPPDLAGEALREWLKEFDQKHQRTERCVAWQVVAGNAADLASRVRAALSFCQPRQKAQKHWLRVVFLLDADATWTWLERGGRSHEADLETVWPHRWDLSAIRQRLAVPGMFHTETVCKDVLRVTGGWPFLLDRLLDDCKGELDPRGALRRMDEALEVADSELVEAFFSRLGLAPGRLPLDVLRFVRGTGEVPVDLLASLMRDEPRHAQLSEPSIDVACEYLERMGCLERSRTGDDSLTVEATVARVVAPA